MSLFWLESNISHLAKPTIHSSTPAEPFSSDCFTKKKTLSVICKAPSNHSSILRKWILW